MAGNWALRVVGAVSVAVLAVGIAPAAAQEGPIASDIRARVESGRARAEAAVADALARVDAEIAARTAGLPPDLQAWARRRARAKLFAAVSAKAGAGDPGAAWLAAEIGAPPGCAEHPIESGHSLGAWITVPGATVFDEEPRPRVEYSPPIGTTATATVTLDAPLCQPLPLTLASFKHDGANPTPHPFGSQTLVDHETQVIQEVGTYTLAVDVPTIGGQACASQIDLFRADEAPQKLDLIDLGQVLDPTSDFQLGGIGIDLGYVIGTAIDMAFLGPLNAKTFADGTTLNFPTVPACDTEVAAETETPPADPGDGDGSDVEVAGAQVSGSLPVTGVGGSARGLALVGATLVLLGWLVLAGRGARDLLAPR